MKIDKEIKFKAKSIEYREKPSVHAICFKPLLVCVQCQTLIFISACAKPLYSLVYIVSFYDLRP